MFYSETLLSKTGPLARVWLSANVERKLSKSHILTSDIGDSVNAIVDRGQAPLALRLSGQLLLGVVRIYSRKARYLLDDCNEAILKIKMAFRPGNVDLPANQSHTANSESLNLPDVITEIDLLGPGPDPSLLLSQLPEEDPLLDLGSSQPLNRNLSRGRASSVMSTLLDEDGLDPSSALRRDSGIEVGRRDTAHRSLLDDGDTTLQAFDDQLLENVGIDFTNLDDLDGLGSGPEIPGLDDTAMDGVQDDNMLPVEEDDALAGVAARQQHHATRGSESPLSSARSSIDRQLDRTFQHDQTIYEQDEESVHQAQRAKKRKILQADADTQIRGSQIREQQNNRSKILKPAAFLPRDPVLLALMEMQKNGSFVSNILGDGRSKGWAPELRGVLSLEVIRQSGGLKRKRGDALNANITEEPSAGLDGAQPGQLSGADYRAPEEEVVLHADDDLPQADGSMFDIAQPMLGSEGNHGDFDETTMPILHPNDSGPVSVGTKHAVHLLRARFGADAEDSPGKRQRSNVMFHELLPEATTSRADATKMFFETLVLATKDAIRVEQVGNKIGGPLRMRAKRGLWGAWAETEAGGEIDQEHEQEVLTA